jgi:response regulator RpfG family c-di-GMP phosphodiesterase
MTHSKSIISIPKRVILIDDDEIYLMVSRKIIETINDSIEIDSFSATQAALDYFKHEFNQDSPISTLILLDVNMPLHDGWTVLEELFRTTTIESNVKIYIVTSSVDNRDLEKVQQNERISGMLSKPISLSTYKELLEGL